MSARPRSRVFPDDRLTRRERRALRHQHGPTLPAVLVSPPAPAVLSPSPARAGRGGLVERVRARVRRRYINRVMASPALAPVVAAASVVVVGVVCLAILAGALLAGRPA